MAADYGPLAMTVLYASNLVAAVASIRMVTLGKALWEPKVEGFHRAPVRVAGVIAIVALAIIFAKSRKNPSLDVWVWWAAGVVGATLLFFVVDIFFRGWLIVRCPGMKESVFGGVWLTRRASDIVHGREMAFTRGDLVRREDGRVDMPAGAHDLFCSFSRRERTRVWPPASTATATILVVFVFCTWNALATTSVAIAATLIAISIG